MSANSPQIKAFRVGPKNKRLPDPAGGDESTEYSVVVEYNLPLPELLDRHGVDLAPGSLITPESIPWPNQATAVKRFELFDFSFRAEYGRSGVDEEFVRDKFNHFNFLPATLPELICFASHLRNAYRDQWFESKTIIALGSVLSTTEVVRKKGWFNKEQVGVFRHYPELECISGRPRDQIGLSTTEQDRDGNWPNETLFLAAAAA